MPRVLLIGWDGADWRILDPLLDKGALPNLQALIDKGAKGILKSTIPTHSWSAWPSFLTGVEPADHGVYDILETVPGTHKQFPVTYRSIKERTLIPDLNAAGKKTLLINGMSWTTYRNRPDAFMDEVFEITKARIKAQNWIIDNNEWDLAAFVHFSTDRVQHCLSEYIAPDHPDYAQRSKEKVAERIRDAYRMIDDALGALVSKARDDDLVLFISDHGFQSCVRCVHMDQLLRKLGFLHFTAKNALLGPMQWGAMRQAARKVYDLLGLHGKVSLPQPVNWAKTRAYTTIRSTGEGVSVNLQGREVDGVVPPEDYERVRDELAEAIGGFVDPVTGRSPVKKVWRREEVFKGKHLEHAPDLLFEPAELYSLTHAKSAVEDADWVSGDHRIDGVIVAAGPEVRPDAFGEPAALIDVAPTILAAL